MRIIFILAILSIMFSAGAGELFTIFKYYKKAESNQSSDSNTVSSITLDSDIYRETPVFPFCRLRNNFLIRDEKGKKIPYALRRLQITKKQIIKISFPVKIEEYHDKGAFSSFVLKQDDTPQLIDSIFINTPDKNFEKEVSVSFSNDGKKYTPMPGKKPLIYDYSKAVALRKTTIKLIKPVNYKYITLELRNLKQETASPVRMLVTEERNGITSKKISSIIKKTGKLKIESCRLFKHSEKRFNDSNMKRKYPFKIIESEEKEKYTSIYVSSNCEPLTEIQFTTSSTNFSRRVKIYGSMDKIGLYPVTSFTWKKSKVFKQNSINNGNVHFAESLYKYYCIIIKNGDNPPLQNIKVSAQGNIYRLIMLGKQSKHLNVYYGTTFLPDYEISKLLPKSFECNEIKYTLSKQMTNPNFISPEKPGEYKWIYTLVIVLTAVILGFILYKNIGKLNSIEND